VVLTHAQNARQSWDWLQDGLLEPDRIQFGDGPVQNLALQGRNLRIIRLRDGERDETPQWWAPDDDDEDEAGLSKGLWVPPGPEDDRRVFYATGAKGASHQFSRVEDTKLTWHATDKAPDGEINGGASAWNPTLLEITVAGCAAGDRPGARLSVRRRRLQAGISAGQHIHVPAMYPRGAADRRRIRRVCGALTTCVDRVGHIPDMHLRWTSNGPGCRDARPWPSRWVTGTGSA